MQTIYRLNARELDSSFIESLKTTFKDKEIEIAVYEVDETDYLMKSGANRKRLIAAVGSVNENKNLIEVTLE